MGIPCFVLYLWAITIYIVVRMDSFNTYLTNVDVDFWRNLCAGHGTLRHYKKGGCFCRTGESKSLFGFIQTGIFKYSVIDSEGNERVTGLVFGGTPVGDYLNLVSNNPVRTDIVVVTNADVFVCDSRIVSYLLQENPAIYAQTAEALFRQTYDRFLDLYRKSPKDRYLELLATCPEILQQVPLKELASYLQITPTHLSRIRKEITFNP